MAHRRSFVASVSSLADALSALQPAALQSFYMSQDGLAALQVILARGDVLVLRFAILFSNYILQMFLDFVKRTAVERAVDWSRDGAALAEVIPCLSNIVSFLKMFSRFQLSRPFPWRHQQAPTTRALPPKAFPMHRERLAIIQPCLSQLHRCRKVAA